MTVQELLQNLQNAITVYELILFLPDNEQKIVLVGKRIYSFGHCNATGTLVDLLMQNGISVQAILDNNEKKHGKTCRDIVSAILQPVHRMSVKTGR